MGSSSSFLGATPEIAQPEAPEAPSAGCLVTFTQALEGRHVAAHHHGPVSPLSGLDSFWGRLQPRARALRDLGLGYL